MFNSHDNSFNGTLSHDGWVYKVRQIELPDSGIRTSFQSYRHVSQMDGEFTPSNIDVYWPNAERDAPKFVVGKDIYHFDTLGNSPIMTFWKNRHRWDNLEMIAPTRERLLSLMINHGFTDPWLIFQDHRIFPTFIRIKPQQDATSSLGEVIEKGMSAHELSKYLTDPSVNMIKRRGRYLPVVFSEGCNVQDPAFLEHIHQAVNILFFQYGKVMVCKRVYETGTPYQGNKGDQYFDLKVLVDKAAPFSDGRIDHGWERVLHLK